MSSKTINIPPMTEKQVNRFWSKIAITANSNKCWNWQAVKHRGYGSFSIGYTTVVSTRVSYYLHYKIDPIGKSVLHKCDNPSCCNPNHLFLGTPNDNSKDMVNKNRQAFGESVKTSKLNENDIIDIRKIYADGKLTQEQIGDIYGVSKTTIRRIVIKTIWKHVS